jgi:hypothetical protein
MQTAQAEAACGAQSLRRQPGTGCHGRKSSGDPGRQEAAVERSGRNWSTQRRSGWLLRQAEFASCATASGAGGGQSHRARLQEVRLAWQNERPMARRRKASLMGSGGAATALAQVRADWRRWSILEEAARLACLRGQVDSPGGARDRDEACDRAWRRCWRHGGARRGGGCCARGRRSWDCQGPGELSGALPGDGTEHATGKEFTPS